jgi:MraZ protein
LRLPPKIKKELGENPVATMLSSNRITVYSNEQWIELQAKLDAVPQSDEEASRWVTIIYGNTYELEFDSQGRTSIPQQLRELAKLTKNVYTIGIGKRAEIWAEEIYDKQTEGMDYAKALPSLKAYGI